MFIQAPLYTRGIVLGEKCSSLSVYMTHISTWTYFWRKKNSSNNNNSRNRCSNIWSDASNLYTGISLIFPFIYVTRKSVLASFHCDEFVLLAWYEYRKTWTMWKPIGGPFYTIHITISICGYLTSIFCQMATGWGSLVAAVWWKNVKYMRLNFLVLFMFFVAI